MSIRDTFKARLASMGQKAEQGINESVEQINELSDDKLKQYSAKAREQLKGIASKRGPKGKKDKAVIAKREAGNAKAAGIQSERHAKAWDAHSKASHAAFKEAAHKTLSDHGYTVAHAGPNSNVYTKHDPETNSLFIAKHHFGHPSTRDSHHSHEGAIKLVSSNGTTSDVRHSSWNLRPSRILHGDKPVDLHAEHGKSIHDELERHHRWSKDSSFNSHMNESVEPVTDEMLNEAFDDLTEEQLDELSAADNVREDEGETLEEGRGRPRKDGTSAEGADREHIMMQMRKHVSLRGANPIEFADGSKHKITDGQARLAQVMHSQLRTSIEKGHFEKKLDHSHESFSNALKNKESAGHAPEEKSRITLPAMDRLKRLQAAAN